MSNNVPSGGWFIYDENKDSYNLNTKILATAVICLASVVVLVVFLHLYVRLVLLRRHHRPGSRRTTRHLLRFYMSNPAPDDPANAGLGPSAIAALPTHPYRTTTSKQSGSKGEESSAECAVCLSAVEEGEMVRALPGCKHLFHVGCIDMWLGSHSSCPVCRAAVEPPPPTVVEVNDASSTVPSPRATQESSAAAPACQEGTSSSGSKDLGSASSRLSSSFRRMLSWERPTGRRAQGEGMEALERQ